MKNLLSVLLRVGIFGSLGAVPLVHVYVNMRPFFVRPNEDVVLADCTIVSSSAEFAEVEATRFYGAVRIRFIATTLPEFKSGDKCRVSSIVRQNMTVLVAGPAR